MKIRQKSLSNLYALAPNEPRMRGHLRKNRKRTVQTANSGETRVGRRVAPCTASVELNLIQQVLANDPTAQDQLFKMYARKLYRTAFAILRNKQDAEDAAQDSWLRAFNNLNSFQGRSSFSTWLTRVAINSALMIFRKNRSARAVSVEELDELEIDSLNLRGSVASPNPEQICAEHERSALLKEAVNNLRPRLRTAVELGTLSDLSMSETARGLGISIGTLKTRLYRARVVLRKSPALGAIAQAKSELAA